MMDFNYRDEYAKQLTAENISYLSRIYEYKGRQAFLGEEKIDTLKELKEPAKFNSIASFSRLNGITINDFRMKKLIGNVVPRQEQEKETAGYRDAWVWIHQNYTFLPFTPETVLELHKILYKYRGNFNKGSFRKSEHHSQTKFILNDVVPADEIPNAMKQVCGNFNEAIKERADPLLLIPMAILDIMRICPFSDGNERICLLLLKLLLDHNGFCVGNYSSLEKQIEESHGALIHATNNSLSGTGYGEVDYGPFTQYVLHIVADAYDEFFKQVRIFGNIELSKIDQIREITKNMERPFTKSDIRKQFRTVSEKTLQRAFEMLIQNNEIKKIGGGRYTTYIWNGAK